MWTEDSILDYLYDKEPTGKPVRLNEWIYKEVSDTKDLDFRDPEKMSVVWIKYILLGMDRDGKIHFLNKNNLPELGSPGSFENQSIDVQLQLLEKTEFMAQLTDKGKQQIRADRTYCLTRLNIIASLAIAFAVLVLQVATTIRDYNKPDVLDNSKAIILLQQEIDQLKSHKNEGMPANQVKKGEDSVDVKKTSLGN